MEIGFILLCSLWRTSEYTEFTTKKQASQGFSVAEIQRFFACRAVSFSARIDARICQNPYVGKKFFPHARVILF